MVHQENAKYFLLEQFQGFYTEVIRLKLAAQMERPAAEIWKPLADYLDREWLGLNRAGRPRLADVQRELLYVMAAVADETFVHLQIEPLETQRKPWEGQQYWLENLLELRLFRSHVAGERIFQNIENVLQRQDQAAEELAAVYLTVLALGFRGQFWGSDDCSAIENYRRELMEYVARSNPRLLEDPKRLFPEAYRYTVQDGEPAKLADPAAWWLLGVGGIVATWLVASGISWTILTKPTREWIRNVDCASITSKAGCREADQSPKKTTIKETDISPANLEAAVPPEGSRHE
jgi:type VI secretion system protein ImpK